MQKINFIKNFLDGTLEKPDLEICDISQSITSMIPNNLTKEYSGRLAVNNLNISIGEGQVYGFLGPNGAGKTTSIRMILGLIKPSKGSVEVFGKTQNSKKTR